MLVGLVNELATSLGRDHVLTHIQLGLAPATLSDIDGRMDGGSNNCDILRAPLSDTTSVGRGGRMGASQRSLLQPAAAAGAETLHSLTPRCAPLG